MIAVMAWMYTTLLERTMRLSGGRRIDFGEKRQVWRWFEGNEVNEVVCTQCFDLVRVGRDCGRLRGNSQTKVIEVFRSLVVS